MACGIGPYLRVLASESCHTLPVCLFACTHPAFDISILVWYTIRNRLSKPLRYQLCGRSGHYASKMLAVH